MLLRKSIKKKRFVPMALLSINPAGRERIINPGSIYIRICNPNESGGTNPAQHKGFLPRQRLGRQKPKISIIRAIR